MGASVKPIAFAVGGALLAFVAVAALDVLVDPTFAKPMYRRALAAAAVAGGVAIAAKYSAPLGAGFAAGGALAGIGNEIAMKTQVALYKAPATTTKGYQDFGGYQNFGALEANMGSLEANMGSLEANMGGYQGFGALDPMSVAPWARSGPLG